MQRARGLTKKHNSVSKRLHNLRAIAPRLWIVAACCSQSYIRSGNTVGDLCESNREPREKLHKTLGERAKPSRFRDLLENAAVPFSPLSTIYEHAWEIIGSISSKSVGVEEMLDSIKRAKGTKAKTDRTTLDVYT